MSVTNDGPSTATNTKLVDSLPAGMSISGSLPRGCTASGAKITCIIGTLKDGQSATRAINVLLSAKASSGSKFVNQASATSSVPDPSPITAKDIWSVKAVKVGAAGRPARLGVAVFTPARILRRGERYKIKVSVTALRSSGSTDSRKTELCVALPANVGYRGSSGTRRPGGRVCWKVGKLARGKSRSYLINAIAAKPGRSVVKAAANASNALRVTASSPVRHAPSFTG
jgi:hypothetical protein